MTHLGLPVFALLAALAVGAGCGGGTGAAIGGDGQQEGQEGSGPATAAGGSASCTSQQVWVGGDRESSSMHPGAACISCHDSQGGEAPTFAIAGTVYPSAHDPNDCLGTNAAGAQVVITDAKGQSFTIGVNGAGNFLLRGAIAMPFQAKVVAGGKERAMSAAQTNGDCNSCHTETGANGAPGRIQAP
jgi:hypothetical protein